MINEVLNRLTIASNIKHIYTMERGTNRIQFNTISFARAHLFGVLLLFFICRFLYHEIQTFILEPSASKTNTQKSFCGKRFHSEKIQQKLYQNEFPVIELTKNGFAEYLSLSANIIPVKRTQLLIEMLKLPEKNYLRYQITK